jgi:hypothetical protein
MCRDLTSALAVQELKDCMSAQCYAVFDNDVKDWVVDVSVNAIYMSVFYTFLKRGILKDIFKTFFIKE